MEEWHVFFDFAGGWNIFLDCMRLAKSNSFSWRVYEGILEALASIFPVASLHLVNGVCGMSLGFPKEVSPTFPLFFYILFWFTTAAHSLSPSAWWFMMTTMMKVASESSEVWRGSARRCFMEKYVGNFLEGMSGTDSPKVSFTNDGKSPVE